MAADTYEGHFLYYDPPLELEAMTSDELQEAAVWYSDGLLSGLAKERKVSEGAELFLKNLVEGEDQNNGKDI